MNFLTIQTLPAAANQLLNALQHGCDRDEPAELFSTEWGRIDSWLERHRSVFTNPAERAELENLDYIWQQIARSLDSTLPIDELSSLLVQAYEIHDRLITAQAARGRVADQRVNAAVLAGYNGLDPGADPKALAVWLPQLEAFLEEVWQKVLTVGLPAEERGFAALSQGIDEWRLLAGRESTDREEWELVLCSIEWGTRSLEDYFSGRTVPEIGSPEFHLEHLKALDLDDREHVEKTVECFVESFSGRLESLVIFSHDRTRLIEELDSALVQLENSDPTSLRALEALLSQAATLERADRKLGRLEESLLFALSATLREQAPDLFLEAYLNCLNQQMSAPLPGTENVQSYLDDGDFAHLHEAMDLLLNSVSSRVERALQDYPTPRSFVA